MQQQRHLARSSSDVLCLLQDHSSVAKQCHPVVLPILKHMEAKHEALCKQLKADNEAWIDKVAGRFSALIPSTAVLQSSLESPKLYGGHSQNMCMALIMCVQDCFDIVFLDPPYEISLMTLVDLLPVWCGRSTLIYVERPSTEGISSASGLGKIWRESRAGKVSYGLISV